jgi:phage major head subunit gpT-like protein
MTVPSAARDEQYGWMGQFPNLREWIGPRHVHGLRSHSFTITNKKFESTAGVGRDDISDDRLGVFKPMFAEMGWLARQHPEERVFGLLASGFSETCFDGQPYFDADHPLTDKNGAAITVSNMQAGSNPGWYLLDTSRAVRPLVWQVRETYDFQTVNRASDEHVFLNDTYYFGVRARVSAGFGLWQLGFGSKADLTAENYALARAAMMAYRSDGGRVLGINPNIPVVPPALERKALHILNSEIKDTGGSNPWKGTADLIVTPFVAE